MPARSHWWFRAVLLAVLLPAGLARVPVLAAQDEAEHGTPWRLSYFPYIAGMANDGPAYFLRARYWQPAEYEARNTYTAAIDGAVLLQLADHLLEKRGRHGKGDADIAAGRREDRRVHADDLAIQIEGRAAGIAAVHRRVDLEVVVRA